MTFMSHSFFPATISELIPDTRLDAPGFPAAVNRVDAVLENETNPFGQLVSLVKEHDSLVAELGTLRGKLDRAASYLESDGCHAILAKAYFDRLKLKHSTILYQLRVNRLEARRFLQKLDKESRRN